MPADPASARAVVIPFGLEASVSYGGGTAAGPQAILAASQQLELYDEELGREPYLDYGVAALREPAIAQPIEAALEQLAGIVEAVLAAGKFPFVLGGEHSLTAGAIRPFAARHKDLVVLQFDAHADLRDGYQGERFSHAAAMRRVLDHPGVSLVSVGIRADLARPRWSSTRPTATASPSTGPRTRRAGTSRRSSRRCAGRPVYVTFDIDALDAAVMPATGTPTPGGLGYWQALAILRRACAVGNVVGADLVEFAPIAGFHAYDYTAAALAYKMLSYALATSRAEARHAIRQCLPDRRSARRRHRPGGDGALPGGSGGG